MDADWFVVQILAAARASLPYIAAGTAAALVVVAVTLGVRRGVRALRSVDAVDHSSMVGRWESEIAPERVDGDYAAWRAANPDVHLDES